VRPRCRILSVASDSAILRTSVLGCLFDSFSHYGFIYWFAVSYFMSWVIMIGYISLSALSNLPLSFPFICWSLVCFSHM